MDNRDKILEFIKIKGPVLPVHISKEIGTDILMASAHLAELTATGKLKVSSLKVGGSPLYLLTGQEAQLEKHIAGFNDKEMKAFNLLKEKRILRDVEMEPVVRVALREIKDFATQLNVNFNSNKEIFWKWFLTNDEEAEQLIKAELHIPEKPAEKLKEEKIQEKQEPKPIEEKAKQDVLQQNLGKSEKAEKEKLKARKQKSETSEFLSSVTRFFEKNKVNVISAEVIKKNSEMDFVIEIPSVMGNLQYYCKAKNKKKISDSDLSNAYVKGQFRKLPVIFLSEGELSSKAHAMIGKELNSLTFKRI